VLAAAFALSAPAFSQPQASSGADDALRADEHFHKGQKLVDLGRLKEAREEYLAAFRLKRSYDVAGNLGSLELDLKLPRDAAEHLLFALHNYAASGTTPAQLAKAKERFAEVERQVGRIKVSVSVARADVFVDGKPVGLTPLGEDLFVDEGERTIEARLAGYEPASQTIKIAKGSAQLVTLKLTPAAAPPAPSASASAAPAVTASASATPPPVPSGTAPPIVPVHSGGASTPVLVTGGVVSGLAVVAGVVFTVLANGKASDAQTQLSSLVQSNGSAACTGTQVPTGCSELHNMDHAKDTFANAALWSFVGGGAVGAATLIFAIAAAPAGPPKAGVRVAPIVTAQGGGVMVGGSW
jgi:hypothetical protein